MPIDLAQSSERPVDALADLMTDAPTGLPAHAQTDLLAGGCADLPSTCDPAR